MWKVRKYYPNLLQNRPHDVFTRSVKRLLESIHSLNSQPLNVARQEEKRAIVDGRNFAVLLSGVLRQRGVPSRARCGFATYLEDTHYQDHWICDL